MKRPAILIGAAMMIQAAASLAQAGTLTLNLDTGNASGALRAAVFASQAAFDADEVVTATTGPANGAQSALTFDDLKPGTYGIALFLDENDNGKLDTNLLGAPTEPFGFSMNPKIGFSAPKFKAFQFDYDGSDIALNIKLNGG